ncbi:hypothetical protein EN850_13385 [Mesorhizobium sp. M8A.F.Ca.ET.207.01.1.1]|uniref:hypothetical protein n=1 Tax=Mesorhizobium sp. M8A.F.Ca.ET.207.01.1.1 TaxID=2563968 RepID=UPI000FD2D875|nr:hypothetical protein [Mesorhizobium sp. M8A.F.Ca.ET.207.01.1.1]RUW95857.1 hypothetical protein EOA30_31230 [Mesorhizobium sp. M8A.F.Ca.ET.059.01.1.1]TGQ80269.1 hypothetical protein EN850_13385 [Mesorhizobium sp. M8A.F.Ca.ET.207.01.1.1]
MKPTNRATAASGITSLRHCRFAIAVSTYRNSICPECNGLTLRYGPEKGSTSTCWMHRSNMDVHPNRTELKEPFAMNRASTSTPQNAEANGPVASFGLLSRMEPTMLVHEFFIG